jgi:glutamate--cysteine ligase
LKSTLDSLLRQSLPMLEHWLAQQWASHPPPLYSSVDVRHAGFKIAPVDTNLFPGGWNNLSQPMLPLAIRGAQRAIERLCPDARQILLVPENHTRNAFYMANLAQLQGILRQAGYEVRIGTMHPDLQQVSHVDLPGGESLTLEPLLRQRDRVGLKDFDPCLIVLNNDLSSGTPEILRGLQSQALAPALPLGWSVRRKSQHFAQYRQVAAQVGDLLGIDPWWIDPLFDHASGLDFSKGQGLDALKTQVDALLTHIGRKYQAHGIAASPYVVVKADNGTYGMGIMVVRSVADLDQLNRRTRNKMSVIKDGQMVSDVLIQEGVLTQERVNGQVAEPVVYMMGAQVVGGFYRTHAERGVDENLNAPGAGFVPWALTREGALPPQQGTACQIARLAALAASRESLTAPAADDFASVGAVQTPAGAHTALSLIY